MIRTKCLLAAVAVAGVMAVQAPQAIASPLTGVRVAPVFTAGTGLEQVQWRGGRGGYRGGFRGGRGFGIGAGILGGAILGSALAAPYYDRPYSYYPTPRYYAAPSGGDADAYCFSRFRSYDPSSGTYLGYDGYRHPCP